MKKLIAILMAMAMVLALAACTPDEGNGSTAGTTTGAAVDPDAVMNCICGANEGEDHIGECTGEEVAWTAWSETTLPDKSGYYYAAHETDEVTLDYTDYTMFISEDGSARDIVIDLNGKTFVGPGDLMVTLDGIMNLTITDSSAEHKGTIKADDSLTSSSTHALIYAKNDGDLETSNSVSVYRATLDASAVKNSSTPGAAISIEASNTLNMYNATVLGGGVSSGNGGAIANDGTANLYDTVVYGAETIKSEDDGGANNTGLGGAIHTSGDLNLVDCTIYGAPAGRGGAVNVAGGTTTMAGGIIYGADVTNAACAVNMKSLSEGVEAHFIMKASDKGEPVIDCSGKTSGNFGGAFNIDGYNTLTQLTMECGEIIGGTAAGAGAGGCVIVQDTMNDGKDGKGVFVMNGGTLTSGISSKADGNGGANIRITKGGVVKLNGGVITAGKDSSGNNAGGIKVENTAHSLIIGGTAQITGNEGNDIFLASGKTFTVKADWAGNGEKALVVGMADGTGAFAAAAEGETLTEAMAAFFAGNVKLADNALALQ